MGNHEEQKCMGEENFRYDVLVCRTVEIKVKN
jgi:hypothetical protein